MLVLSIVILLSAAVGTVAAIGVLRWPQADPARSASKALEGRLSRSSRVRRFLRSRLDPATTTGLALTLALLAVVIAGTAMGVVAYMVRTNSGVIRIDLRVERWAALHVEGLSLDALRLLTALGSTSVTIALAAAAAVYGWWQRRSFSIPLFLVLVVGGQALMSTLIKLAVDRVRPDIGPLGVIGTPSFPSGHSTAAAATFAALAVVLGRNRSARTRAILAGAAAAVAVGVACSRVLLSAHWFSDVVSGLVLGWTWCAVCAVAFGGRLLWYGTPAEEAASSPRSSSGGARRPARASG